MVAALHVSVASRHKVVPRLPLFIYSVWNVSFLLNQRRIKFGLSGGVRLFGLVDKSKQGQVGLPVLLEGALLTIWRVGFLGQSGGGLTRSLLVIISDHFILII